jgi:FKBP-type peptidyl-prolyl cis-trans isomerase FkpA
VKNLIGFLFLVILVSACSKDNKQCEYDPCAISAPAAEVATLEAYLAANTITATKHCSGYYYIIDVAGTGSSADICSSVTVKYKGQLTNGTVFDQATTPVSFQLNILIEAWKKAILQIKTGGKIRIYVPPSLAYGSQVIRDNAGNILIPANSILIFEIELVAIS